MFRKASKASIDLACKFFSKVSSFDVEESHQMSYIEGFFENIFGDDVKYDERIPFVMSSLTWTWGAPIPSCDHGDETGIWRGR